MLKNPICKKCGELKMPSGGCTACLRLTTKQRIDKALAKARSPIPWMDRQKKARVLAKDEKKRIKRARKIDRRKDAQEAKYRRGRLLLAIVLDWLRMFFECFEKDETGAYWLKPGTGEQLQVMLIAIEILLPEFPAIFKFSARSEKENSADALRHSLFTCMLETARTWSGYERRIIALRQSGSISPEAETQMLSDLRQQVQQRFRFYPPKDLTSPHQKT
jgi:hypothetical protein